MKFTQSVIAAATLHSMTLAVNVESNTSYTFEMEDYYKRFIDDYDPTNEKGIKGALAACEAGKPS